MSLTQTSQIEKPISFQYINCGLLVFYQPWGQYIMGSQDKSERLQDNKGTFLLFKVCLFFFCLFDFSQFLHYEMEYFYLL